ncbi:MAG: hypothetical protein AB7U07_04445 [Thermoleophilia bacterium]
MSRRADGCGRASIGAGGPAAPLSAATADPVACQGCGNVFGRGAEAGTVCPYCGGALQVLRTDPGPAGRPGGMAA